MFTIPGMSVVTLPPGQPARFDFENNSTSIEIPRGRLATPLSVPNTDARSSEAPSATFGCSRKSPAVAINYTELGELGYMVERSQESLRRRKCIQACDNGSLAVVLEAQFTAHSPDKLGLMIDERKPGAESVPRQTQKALINLALLALTPAGCRPINLVWDDYGTIAKGIGASKLPPGLQLGRKCARDEAGKRWAACPGGASWGRPCCRPLVG
jgi:hypothetical protein